MQVDDAISTSRFSNPNDVTKEEVAAKSILCRLLAQSNDLWSNREATVLIELNRGGRPAFFSYWSKDSIEPLCEKIHTLVTELGWGCFARPISESKSHDTYPFITLAVTVKLLTPITPSPSHSRNSDKGLLSIFTKSVKGRFHKSHSHDKDEASKEVQMLQKALNQAHQYQATKSELELIKESLLQELQDNYAKEHQILQEKEEENQKLYAQIQALETALKGEMKITPKALELVAKMLEEFTDPFTLDTFSHPVISPSGGTYSEAPLAEWLRQNAIDPLTREPLRGRSPYRNILAEHVEELVLELAKELHIKENGDI